jgi:hypothetical protein
MPSLGDGFAMGAGLGFTIGMVNVLSKLITGTGWIEEGAKIAMGLGGGN